MSNPNERDVMSYERAVVLGKNRDGVDIHYLLVNIWAYKVELSDNDVQCLHGFPINKTARRT